MSTYDVTTEIRDLNLNYLMLARRMIAEDKAMAVCRLGLSLEIAQLLEGMSAAQIIKLADTPTLLTRFRFDDAAILGMLTHGGKERALAHSHAAILLAGQPVEQIV